MYYSQNEITTSIFPPKLCHTSAFSEGASPRIPFQGCHLFLWTCYQHEKVRYCAGCKSFLSSASVLWEQNSGPVQRGKSELRAHSVLSVFVHLIILVFFQFKKKIIFIKWLYPSLMMYPSLFLTQSWIYCADTSLLSMEAETLEQAVPAPIVPQPFLVCLWWLM